ncbi:hypothetical protein E4U57_004074 [Claviceps arundinis]|uniref:Uncharacterized protein n=1 Tax=Claviceps arundinis TaxID=1623583 RepID=A0A9P7MXW1_9HYPO|nr:hypothetical protein E4U57_004074 [Claviceps arundinis]KAG5972567.1 hypothetical protein E4U56_005895 [Claviceps arundinis]
MVLLKPLLLLGAVFVKSTTKAFGTSAPIEGYGVVKSSRNIRLAPGDPPVTLNGPLEEVTSKDNKPNPRWARDLKGRKPSDDSAGSAAAKPIEIYCNNGPGNISTAYIEDSLHMLAEVQVEEKPHIGPGPGMCSKVICKDYSAIWWCNDHPEPFELDSYADVISGTKAILDRCMGSFTPWLLQCKALMPGNWSVIIRRDIEYCSVLGTQPSPVKLKGRKGGSKTDKAAVIV